MSGVLLMVKDLLLARILQYEVLEGPYKFSVSVNDCILFERVDQTFVLLAIHCRISQFRQICYCHCFLPSSLLLTHFGHQSLHIKLFSVLLFNEFCKWLTYQSE